MTCDNSSDKPCCHSFGLRSRAEIQRGNGNVAYLMACRLGTFRIGRRQGMTEMIPSRVRMTLDDADARHASQDAFPKACLLVQPVVFQATEVAARDDPDHASVGFHHRHMAEAAIVHDA